MARTLMYPSGYRSSFSRVRARAGRAPRGYSAQVTRAGLFVRSIEIVHTFAQIERREDRRLHELWSFLLSRRTREED